MDLHDFRPQLARAQAWVAELIDGVRPEFLGLPTPCPDYDVRGLIAHLYFGTRRVQVMGEGGDAMAVEFGAADLPTDLGAGYRALAEAAQGAWGDDEKLTTLVRAPWGEVPGGMALGGYLNEALVHGWDLATATGQPSEAEPELAVAALRVAQRAIPADFRGGPVPFGPLVPSTDADSPTVQLVHWSGRA